MYYTVLLCPTLPCPALPYFLFLYFTLPSIVALLTPFSHLCTLNRLPYLSHIAELKHCQYDSSILFLILALTSDFLFLFSCVIFSLLSSLLLSSPLLSSSLLSLPLLFNYPVSSSMSSLRISCPLFFFLLLSSSDAAF